MKKKTPLAKVRKIKAVATPPNITTENNEKSLTEYKELANQLFEASKRLDFFQRSMEILRLCHSEDGILSSVIDIANSVVPIQDHSIFLYQSNEWKLVKGLSLKASNIDTALLNWTLANPEPSLVPVEDEWAKKQGYNFYLLIPILIGRKPYGCIVGCLRSYDGGLSQNTSRLLSALIRETAVALENTRVIEQTRQASLYVCRVLDSFPQAIFTVDTTGRIILFNKNAEYIFDVPSIVALDEKYTEVFHKSFADYLQQLMTRVMKGEPAVRLEIKGSLFKRFEEAVFAVEVLPVFEASNNIEGILFSFLMKDIVG